MSYFSCSFFAEQYLTIWDSYDFIFSLQVLVVVLLYS